jgi:polar amino acid transport system ATP-binding protein
VLGCGRAEAEWVARANLEGVGLADRAVLSMGPSVMLFDGPTSALVPELVGDVLTVMRRSPARA